MATARDLERIYVQIVLGIPKTSSTVPLTAELDTAWDRIAGEVAEMLRRGYALDIPAETPDVVIAAPVDPVEGS